MPCRAVSCRDMPGIGVVQRRLCESARESKQGPGAPRGLSL
nr:MAG TPA: hypothetical protein [Caudoviricetes sp.]